MKESLQRLMVWAKAHPYLAGLILVGVVFLAWLTIKRGGFSSSSSGLGSIEEGAEEPRLGSDTLGGLDVPTDTASPGGGEAATDGAGNSIDTSSGFGALESGGAGGFESLPPVDIPPSYAVTTGAALASPASSALVESVAASEAARDTPIRASEARTPARPATARPRQPIQTRPADKKAIEPARTSQNPLQAFATSIIAAVTPKSPGLKGGEKKETTRPARTPAAVKTPAKKSPAQSIGKPANFTGTWMGIKFIGGSPVSSSDWNLFRKLSRPSGGSSNIMR